MPIPNSRLVGGVRSWPGVSVGRLSPYALRGSWSRMNVCDRPGAPRLLVADVAAFRNNLRETIMGCAHSGEQAATAGCGSYAANQGKR